jgi:hypothetical protein
VEREPTMSISSALRLVKLMTRAVDPERVTVIQIIGDPEGELTSERMAHVADVVLVGQN